MIMVPPRHGKSELASIRFPAWFLGRNPTKQIISASATAEFASDFGRVVRNIIGSEEYQEVFDTQLADDSQSRGKWHTSHGGVYYAVGIGGSVMGRGAHIFLIDDPFATMQDAQSETGRKTVWEWYSGTAYNRLEQGGAIVVINHRMHEADLCGRLLEQQAAGGDTFEVVELPAISDKGEALWPEKYPLSALERIRANTLPRDWSGLYQQRPAPEEGNFFKKDWLQTYIKLPGGVRFYGASDYAVTDDGGDWTVHVVGAMDLDGNLYIEDFWRGQTDSYQWVVEFLRLVKKYKPLMWAEERGQIISSVGPFLARMMNDSRTFCAREQFTSSRDKPTRARSIQAMWAHGKVYLKAGQPWLPDLMSELLVFPAGKNDDQADALSLLGRLIEEMVGKGIETDTERKMDRYDRAFAKREMDEDVSWKTR